MTLANLVGKRRMSPCIMELLQLRGSYGFLRDERKKYLKAVALSLVILAVISVSGRQSLICGSLNQGDVGKKR